MIVKAALLFALSALANPVGEGPQRTQEAMPPPLVRATPVPTLEPIGPAATDEQQERRLIAARRLADLLSPTPERVMETERQITAAMIAEIRADPDVRRALEVEPKLIETLEKGFMQIVREAHEADGDGYERELADVYATYLTAQDLDLLYRFFESPTGRKLTRLVQENWDLAPIIEGEGDLVEVDEVDRARSGAVPGVVGALTPADIAFYETFEGKDALMRLRGLRPHLNRFEADYMNREDPDLEARLERLFEDFYDAVDAVD